MFKIKALTGNPHTSMTKYLFILGRKQLISIAELIAVLPTDSQYLHFQYDQLLVETNEIENPQAFLNKLGGTIKIIKINQEIKGNEANAIKALADQAAEKFTGRTDKVRYAYFVKTLKQRPEIFLKKALAEAKKKLKSLELSSRFINNNFQNAPIALLKGEGIMKKGAEFAAIEIPGQWMIGETIAIQDIDAYSERDYERPERDARLGMLPPKLAQVMINLSGAKAGVIYDPFCGIGTVMMEANLMGYDAVGSDVSREALAKADSNLHWIHKKSELTQTYRLFQADATSLSHGHLPEEIAAVVSETYLGPPKKQTPEPEKIEMTFIEIEDLLGNFLEAIGQLIKPGTPIVITLLTYRNTHHMGPKFYSMDRFIENIDQFGFHTEELIDADIAADLKIKTSESLDRLLYEREDQVACRTIVKLVKD